MPSLSHEYRDAFPACEGRAYLNCAAVAPGSTRVRAAIAAWLDDHIARGNTASQHWWERAAEVRVRTAELIGAAPGGNRIRQEHVSRSGDGGGGSRLAFRRRGRGGERPGVPVQRLRVEAPRRPRRRGAGDSGGGRGGDARSGRRDHRTANPSGRGELGAVRKRLTAPIWTPSGRLCRDRDVLFVVDAIQQAGAFPHRRQGERHPRHGRLLAQVDAGSGRDRIPVRRAATSCRVSARRWSAGTASRIRSPSTAPGSSCAPTRRGWRRQRLPSPWSTASERRWSCCWRRGSPAPQPTSRRCSTARANALEAFGCEVSPAPEHRAGILMIKPAAADVDALAEACLERGIAVSVRRGRLRLSPHLYNNEDDIDALVELLRNPSANM